MLYSRATMILRERIRHTRDASFDDCWQLYLSAFPAQERRDRDYQSETLDAEVYHMEALFVEGHFVGFIAWWDFDDVVYVEHFAIVERYRSFGYGRALLREFIVSQAKKVVLEVEHGVEEMQARRIGFYERLGFYLSEAEYAQPPYAGESFLPLLLMGYPAPLSEQDVEDFKRRCLPRIHFRFDFAQ